jgi:hypothetical protein
MESAFREIVKTVRESWSMKMAGVIAVSLNMAPYREKGFFAIPMEPYTLANFSRDVTRGKESLVVPTEGVMKVLSVPM